MSRMAASVAALLLMASPASAEDGAALAAYAEKTSVEPRCRTPRGGEIIVCARRNGDRYRLPFVEPEKGDPDHMGVHAERDRLIAQKNNCAEMRAALVGCGMVGVTVGTSIGKGAKPRLRPLSP